ncbi:MAG: prolyl oligopeptidase family serine peptidase [Vicinamibacterales bacterium]
MDLITGLPSVAGTAPTRVTWSPDSRFVAFLWNDQSWPFRDLWLSDATSPAAPLRRLTDFERTAPPPDAPGGDSLQALDAQLRRRWAGGVSEIVWAADSASLWCLYRGDIYRVATTGGAVPTRVTTDLDASDLALSPDGTQLSYLREGDLWLRSVQDGTTVRATAIAKPAIGIVPVGTYHKLDVEIGEGVWGAGLPPYQWSPDSSRIAVHFVDRRDVRKVPFPYYLGPETIMNEHRRGYPGDVNERRTLGVFTRADASLRLLDLPDVTARFVNAYAWSADGRLLVDHMTDTQVDRWLYVADARSLTLRELYHDRRDTRIYTALTAAWSSDGRRAIFVGDRDERYRLYALAPGEVDPTPLTSGDWDVDGTVEMVPATQSIIFTSTAKNPYERQVHRVSDRGGDVSLVTTLAGTHAPVPSPDGRRLATVRSSDTSPPELYTTVIASRPAPATAETRVTHSPSAAFADYPWAVPRYVTFKSRAGEMTLHGRIIEPPNLDPSQKYPVIVGPVYSNTVRNRWAGVNALLQQMLVLDAGYIVFQVDVRGSTGYGRAFREQFLMDWGHGDLDDLESGVDYLRTLPYVDGDRVGIWGSSYGGLLTVYSLFEKPGLFKAGVAGAPALDPTFYGTDDVAIARTPQTHPEAFLRSAYPHARNLRDHLLIIHGMQDDVVPFKTSVVLAEQLMLLGKDFDFAFAPASPHGWTQREHYARFMFRKLVDHFNRWLK